MTKQRLDLLLQLFKHNRLSGAMREELMRAIADGKFDDVIQEDLLAALKLRQTDIRWTTEREESVRNSINAELSEEGIPGYDVHDLVAPSRRRYPVPRMAAAAAIVLLLGAGGLLYLNRNIPGLPGGKARAAMHDIGAPATSRAVLTLSDGRQIFLDSAGKGSLAAQGNTDIVKTGDDQIAYAKNTHARKAANCAVLYNTLSVPRGSRIALITLPDGTRVWLNSESTLHYPTAFTGRERRVDITGEAYFEVAPDASMPFKVRKKNMEVEVLGTRFDVDGYDDEALIKVTLLQGRVDVVMGTSKKSMTPGEQCRLKADGEMNIVDHADLEGAMAWKNGLFHLTSADIPQVLRQIGRWYDLDIEFADGIPAGHLTGDIPRNTSLSKVLDLLELSGLHVNRAGQKIIVTP